MARLSDFMPASVTDLSVLLELMRAFYEAERLPFQRGLLRLDCREPLGDSRLDMVYLIPADEPVVGYLVITFCFSLEFHGIWSGSLQEDGA